MSRQKYTNEEKEILSSYFTNLHGNVFALKNLPEQVKGALFARYSRTHKPLRRLFLDEFYSKASMPPPPKTKHNRRAGEFYRRVFSEYGDDSIAQLCSAHVAVEDVSIVAAKELQRSRLAAYLEKSTRYLDYSGDNFKCIASPYSGRSELPWYLAKRAYELALEHGVSFDDARGALPLATATSFGIHANGQTFERMVNRHSVTPNWEVNAIARKICTAVTKIMPDIMMDSDVSAWKHKQWYNYYGERTKRMDEAKPRTGRGNLFPVVQSPSAQLIAFGGHKDLFDTLIAYKYLHTDHKNTMRFFQNQYNDYTNKVHNNLVDALFAGRKNRRHLPERMLETINATFEIVSDYATYRDLQRHRMVTIEAQPITASLGYHTPLAIKSASPLVQAAWHDAMNSGINYYTTKSESVDRYQQRAAPYTLNMATNVRYVIHANLRQWLYMIELRSAPGAHRTYMSIMQNIYRQLKATCFKQMGVGFNAEFYGGGEDETYDEWEFHI